MRHIFSALILLIGLSQPVSAEDDAAKQLQGSWRLTSFQVRVVGDNEATKEPFGPHPFGRLILAPNGYMAAYLSRPDRNPPAGDAEAAKLLSSMIAYTGRYRFEGDKFITKVDGAWNEIYKQNEQVRFFAVKGGTLEIRTAEQSSGLFPGKKVIATLAWEKED